MFESTYKHIKTTAEITPSVSLQMVNHQIEDLERMLNHSECPLCGQNLDKNDVKETLEKFVKLRDEILYKLPKKQIKTKEQENKEIMDRIAKDEEYTKNVMIYLESHKKQFRSLIKEQKRGIANNLPKLSNEEKDLWNKAMHKFFVSRNDEMQDYDLTYTDVI